MMRLFVSAVMLLVVFGGVQSPAEVLFDPLGNPIPEELLEQVKDLRSVIIVLKDGGLTKKSGEPIGFAGLGTLKKVFAEPSRAKKSTAPVSAAARNLNNMYTAEVTAAGGIGEVISQLSQSSRVEYVEPDWPIELLSAPNDPNFDPEQWSLHNTGQTHTTSSGTPEIGADDADIDWLEAWESPDFPTNEIIIAVVDTGVDYTHPDLVNQMWVNVDEIPGNGIDDDNNGYPDDIYGYDLANTDSDPMDDHLHGTHVAGTIAAEANNNHGIAGICPSAKIMAVKIFDADGRSYSSSGITAIRYAADNDAMVINNSWGGGGYSQGLQDAITYANENGASVMCASGNNGSYMAMYPASYAGAVSVGATDSSDDRAYFSNYGPWVDVMAPGHHILSLFSGGAPVPPPPYSIFDGDLLIISGTSMACPTASGAMGLLMSKYPGHEPWIYEKVMEATCDAGIYSHPSSVGFEGNLGAGRIDVDDMLSYDATNAFIRSSVDLHVGFGRSFLSPGEATNLVIKIGTWLHDVENLELFVTALDADSTLNITNYMIGNMSGGSITNIPDDTFVVGCTTGAVWNTTKRFEVQLKSGDMVLETRTNGFSVYNGQISEFCTADLDGDGIKEVIGKYAGVLSVFDLDGNLKWFQDLGANWSIKGSPSVGDVDGDGTNEVVIVAELLNYLYVSEAGLFVYEHDGSINTNIWPVDLDAAGLVDYYWNTAMQPGLMDADGDGDLDIVVSASVGERARYGVYDETGTQLGYDAVVTTNRRSSQCSLGDIDDDGTTEIVNIEHGLIDGVDRAWLTVRDSFANPLYDIELTGGTNVTFGGTQTAPVMADVDFDGEKEFVIIVTFDEVGYLTVLKQDGTVLDGFPVQVDNSTAYDVPAVADVDGDGDLEIFTYRTDLKQILGFDHHGNNLPYFPLTDTNLPGLAFANGYRVTIGDVDGDGEPELVYGGNYQVDENDDDAPYSFDIIARDINDGLMVPGYPMTLEGLDASRYPIFRIVLDAMAGDEFGTNQYIIASAGSELFVVSTGQPFDPNQQHWTHMNHDARNSYHYDILSRDLLGGFSSLNPFGVNAYTANFKGFHYVSDPSDVTYYWDFDGDGTNDQSGVDLAQPTYNYTTPGVYTVSLTLSNTVGEVYSTTREDYITVYSNLAVDFVQSNPTGSITAPVRVEFETTSENFAQHWFWDFGDGGENSLQAPNNVVGDSGDNWQLASPTPGTLNAGQSNGSVQVSSYDPVTEPIGAQTVLEGDTLEFQMVSTDVDNDEVFQTYLDLPRYSNFASDGRTGTFSWVSAGPAGHYDATLAAYDLSGGGSSTQIVSISVIPRSALVISEIMHTPTAVGDEGEWVELYNRSETPVDIDGWILKDAGSDSHVINAGGALVVPAKSFIVLGRNSDTNLNGGVLVDYVYTNNSFAEYDELILLDGSSNTMAQMNWTNGVSMATGASLYLEGPDRYVAEASSWSVSSGSWQGSLGDSGTPGAANDQGAWDTNYTPQLFVAGSRSVVESNALEFSVSGFDLLDGDAVTLSASNLPAGATFGTATHAGQVTNQFSWANPSPVGVYTMTFYAADSGSMASETITISVVSEWSAPTITASMNEVQADGLGIDSNDFVEILTPAGTELDGCFLAHYDAGVFDGEIWRFTFPSFTVPDDGITNAIGQALGFVVLSQSDAPVSGTDFLLPAALRDKESGLILYDAHTNVLDAMAWGGEGDLTVDDPFSTPVSRSISSYNNEFLHVTLADDGGSTAWGENASFMFPTSGTFTVTLIVSNDFGEVVTVRKDVVVDDYFGVVDTHYVSSAGSHLYPYKTWEEAATNLVAAFEALEPGHTLWVTNGVYKMGGRQELLIDEITVQSVNGPEVTIIDGEGLHPGLQFAGTNSVLDGFTIQNCVGQPPALSMKASGFFNGAGGAIARNMIIRNNERLLFGGTVYLLEASLVDSQILSNKCFGSAGVFASGSTISNCVFMYNEATSGSMVTLSGSSAIHNSLIAENTGRGGLELVTGGHAYNTTIANNTITDPLGGGLFFDGVAGRNTECFNIISYGNSDGRNVYFDWLQGKPENGKPGDRAYIFNCCWPVSVVSQQDPGQVENEVLADPLFVDMAAGNYRLQAGSPCKDQGLDDLAYTNIAQEVLVDFGSTSYLTSNHWNNVTTTNAGLKFADMVNTNGTASGLGLTLLVDFDSDQTGGLWGDDAWPYPSTAEYDSMRRSMIFTTTNLLEISGLQTNAPYDFRFYATAPTGANMKFRIGSLSTDILAAKNTADDHYHYEEFTSLMFDTPQVVIDLEQTGGAYAALGLFHLTEWDSASEVNLLASQLDLDGNPRVTGAHVDIGSYEFTSNNIPSVTVHATPVVGPAALEVDFSATAWDDGSITNYHWNYGDGTTANGASLSAPSHTYGSGLFSATVTVTDDDGMTASASVGIFADPAWPAAPTNFAAINIDPIRNDLSWTDQATNETSFVLQRRVMTNYVEIIIDDIDPEVTYREFLHSWTTIANAEAYGGSYQAYQRDGEGVAYALYTPDLEEVGLYEIYEWHPSDSRHASAVRTEIHNKSGIDILYINQEVNGGQWNLLGTYDLEPGSFVDISPYGNSEWFVADAVKFVRVEPYEPLTTLAANATNAVDSGLTDDLAYGYRIAASNQYGMSPWVDALAIIPSTNILPVAILNSLSPTSGIPDLAVNAIGSGTDVDGTVTNYLWNFGDGYSGSIQFGADLTNASYVYRNIGLYDVTLTVFDSLGYASATVTNSVNVFGAIPTAPINLTALTNGETRIDLAWGDTAFNEDFAIVERKPDGGTFSQLAAVASPATNYSDSSVTPGATYTYRVAVTNEHGLSDWSNEATTNTPDTVAPLLLSAEATTNVTLVITFSEAVDQTTAETAGNYALNNGGIVQSAVRDAVDLKKVTLTAAPLTQNLLYTLTVNNVKDVYDNPIATDSQVTFQYQIWARILFDCGEPANPTPGNWNNITENTAGVKETNAVDSTGVETGIGFEILTGFTAVQSGLNAPGIYPQSAQRDNLATWGDDTILLTGLDTGTLYTVVFFAAKEGPGATYLTTYVIGSSNVTQEAKGNTNQTVEIVAFPDASGELSIFVDDAADKGGGFLSVLELRYPQPTENAEIETSVTELSVPEGSTNVFGLKLSAQPDAETTVTVAFFSGDDDLSVQGESNLVFTTTNWMTNQWVTLAAEPDGDWFNSNAVFRCSSSGMADLFVTATEDDAQTNPDYSLPWSEPFEALSPGTLDGQHGWTAEAGAVVTNADAQAGSQSLSLSEGIASHTFDGAPANIRVEFWSQPVRGAQPGEIAGDVSAVFYVNTNDQIVAYSNTTPITLTSTVSNGWNKFGMECDYVSRVWKLELNGAPVASNLAFYGTPAGFTGFEFQSTASAAAFIDSINLTDQSGSPDTDGDGLPDWWETTYYGDLSPNPGDLSSNGVDTVYSAYIAGLNPTNPASLFELSNVRNILGWNAASGRVYTIYWTSNLLENFQTLETNVSWTPAVFTDTTHTAEEKGFYKIKVELENR